MKSAPACALAAVVVLVIVLVFLFARKFRPGEGFAGHRARGAPALAEVRRALARYLGFRAVPDGAVPADAKPRVEAARAANALIGSAVGRLSRALNRPGLSRPSLDGIVAGMGASSGIYGAAAAAMTNTGVDLQKMAEVVPAEGLDAIGAHYVALGASVYDLESAIRRLRHRATGDL